MVWLFKKKGDIHKENIPDINNIFPDFNQIEIKSRKISPKEEHSFFADVLEHVKKQSTDSEKAANLYRKGFLSQNML